MFGIPCVGFGPAPESVAHTVNDSVPIRHLVDCAAFYAAFGQVYCGDGGNGDSDGGHHAAKSRYRRRHR